MKRLCALAVAVLAVPSLQGGGRDDADVVGEQAETKIAFMSDRDGNWEIYVMDADGTGQTRLTKNAPDDFEDTATDYEPALSPDGSKIAFVSWRDGNAEIYVMNADGSGQTKLTNDMAFDFSPAFSPDGSKIVFVSDRDGVPGSNFPHLYEIYVMGADGSQQTRLTNNTQYETDPTFSPDGSKIVFMTTRLKDFNDVSTGNDIFEMNVDGTGATRISALENYGSQPAFSPDGSKIAFASRGFDRARDLVFELFVMSADGTGVTKLIDHQANDRQPVFSPDGLTIAFTSKRDGNDEIYVVNSDGTNMRRLTNNAARDRSPSFPLLQKKK